MRKGRIAVKDKEVWEKLYSDISKLELPPISDEVRQAMREKNRIASAETPSAQPHKFFWMKFLFASILLMAVSVPMVMFLTRPTGQVPVQNRSVEPVSREDVSTANSTDSSQAVSVSDATDLERIQLRQLNGAVVLSEKTAEELEETLTTYTKNSRVYEDGQFVYNFDEKGRLLEMMNTVPSTDGGTAASEAEITAQSKALMREYYPDWPLADSQMIVTGEPDAYPVWTVEVIRKEADLTQRRILMTYDQTGCLRMMIQSGNGTTIGQVTKAEAVQIALREIRSGQSQTAPFTDEQVVITVENKVIDGQRVYAVFVDKVPLNGGVFTSFSFIIDPDTGTAVRRE